jgi:hypothetical protein
MHRMLSVTALALAIAISPGLVQAHSELTPEAAKQAIYIDGPFVLPQGSIYFNSKHHFQQYYHAVEIGEGAVVLNAFETLKYGHQSRLTTTIENVQLYKDAPGLASFCFFPDGDRYWTLRKNLRGVKANGV